jgi:hypothetical protein
MIIMIFGKSDPSCVVEEHVKVLKIIYCGIGSLLSIPEFGVPRNFSLNYHEKAGSW